METRDVLFPFENSMQSGIGKTRLAILKLPPGEHQMLLTKGDNNHVDDIELYQGLDRLERRHIVGKVCGFLPYIGYVMIVMVNLSVIIVECTCTWLCICCRYLLSQKTMLIMLPGTISRNSNTRF
ncbi:hypothetical protein K503DRAFT_775930 [Rhizopogon vinicolor AM-OR11-026]|uniref:Signal peptidase complex catalytic subunit SEC11 n=1 Tax=Rhizopogon vinicolor AM-OR11-026 TaxID=1314800 RepID=A0A1B7MKL2_9AGAM|nr:hypothetical protein K503DRAFT_775930 [Rhizopogon vinicolor AM-OR11-026]